MQKLVRIVALLAALQTMQTAVAEIAPAPFPVPSTAQPAEYLQAAARFVETNPQSPYTPRVLLDMLMVMTAANRPADADNLRRWVLLGYPASLESRYLVTTFADAAAYRKLLIGTSGPIRERMVPNLGNTLLPAFIVAHGHFKQELMRDLDFVLSVALAAEAANQLNTRDELLAFVRQQPLNDQQRRLLALLFEDRRSAAERSIDLHKLRGKYAADLAVDYLLTTLTDEDRGQPAVQRLLFERDILALRFAQALQRQPSLRADETFDPEYFLAWCILGLQDAVGAQQRWQAVQHPEYQLAAARLAEAAGQLQPTMAAQVALLGDILQNAADKSPRVHVRVQRPAGDQLLDVSLAIDWHARRIQMALLDGTRTVAALESDGAQTRMYFHGNDHVDRYEGAMAPVLALAITPSSAERFDLSFSFRLSESLPEALAAARAILDSPYLRRPDQTWQLLNSMLVRTTLPLPLVEDEQGTTLRWLTATIARPDLTASTMTVSPDGRAIRFQREQLNITCQFGDAEQIVMHPLWGNDLPTRDVTRQQMSMQLMAQIVALIGRDGGTR